MTENNAQEIAKNIIAEWNIAYSAKSGGDTLAIINTETREFGLGWVFCWQTKRFLETRDINSAAVGSSPILVLRDGRVLSLPTYQSIEESMKELELSNKIAKLNLTLDELVKRFQAKMS